MKITIPWHRFLKQESLTSAGTGFSWGDASENSYILGDSSSQRSIDPVFDILSVDSPDLIQPEIKKAFSILTQETENLPIDGVQSPEKMRLHLPADHNTLPWTHMFGLFFSDWSRIYFSIIPRPGFLPKPPPPIAITCLSILNPSKLIY